jgi:ribosome-binding factor A
MAKNKHTSAGPSQRQLRVGELIRRNLSQILGRSEIHDPDLNRMMITVGEVTITGDLSIATAFVLPLGGQGQQEALEALRRNKGEIRHLVAQMMRLRHAPEIRFRIDDTYEQMDNTRRLFEDENVRRDLVQKDDDSAAPHEASSPDEDSGEA